MESILDWDETPGAMEWFGKVFVEETERLIRKDEQARKSWIFKG